MQKTRMPDFLEKLEILIDLLILHLPSDWFVNAKFLSILLSNPNGRYVLSGFLVVVGLIVAWAIFLLIQVLFRGRSSKNEPAALQNTGKESTVVGSSGSDGFQFFKRSASGRSTVSDETALKAIEQEMLTIRQSYIDGHILQDVYVAETRRLYNSAKALKP